MLPNRFKYRSRSLPSRSKKSDDHLIHEKIILYNRETEHIDFKHYGTNSLCNLCQFAPSSCFLTLKIELKNLIKS